MAKIKSSVRNQQKKKTIQTVGKKHMKTKKLKSIHPTKIVEKQETDRIKKLFSEAEEEYVVTPKGPKVEADLSKDKTLKAVELTLQLIRKNNEKELLDEEVQVLLQVVCMKIPKCPLRTVRFTLPHSLVNDSTEVCLIVPDLKRGRRVDPEQTLLHYQHLLLEAGVKNVKVLPYTQLRTEYSQYEAKRRLLNLYDVFLVDGKLCGNVFRVLGKCFINARKLPTSVRLGGKDLKREVEKALTRTSIMLSPRGNTTVVKVGHSKMSSEQVTDNILATSKWLADNYPGGWRNIQHLHVKGSCTTAIPIHVSLLSKNEVDVPVMRSLKKNMHIGVSGELSTIPGAIVTFDCTGNIKLKKENSEEVSSTEKETKDTKSLKRKPQGIDAFEKTEKKLKDESDKGNDSLVDGAENNSDSEEDVKDENESAAEEESDQEEREEDPKVLTQELAKLKHMIKANKVDKLKKNVTNKNGTKKYVKNSKT